MCFRVVTSQEENYIKNYFRRSEDIPTGYRPELYEHWTWGKNEDMEKILEKKESESESDSELIEGSTNVQNIVFVSLDKL